MATDTATDTIATDPNGEPESSPSEEATNSQAEGDAKIDAKLAELDALAAGDDAPSPEDYRPEDDPAKDGPADDKSTDKPEATGEGDDASAPELTPSQQQVLKFHDLDEKDLPEPGPARDATLESLAKSRRQVSKKASEIGEAMVKAQDAAKTAPKAAGDGEAAGPSEGGESESSDAAPQKLTFTEDDLAADDDSFVTKLNAMAGEATSLRSELAEIKAEMATARATDQASEQAQTVKEADTFFEKFWRVEDGQPVSEFPEFGRGPTVDLDSNSDERQARNAVIQKAKIMAMGYEGMDLEAPDTLTLLGEALLTLTPGKHKSAAEASIRKALARRRRSAIPRSSNRPRTPAADDADTRAKRKFDEWEKRTGETVPEK